ncbi:Hypothetical protein, putative [Bodo saltans]|uniref:SIS domain-containing protein n=1 Tax=Bodo saltans TaxID=75058 RepID=A0A0S4IIQ7_BODSA|nr:Hypothetical protein, putative [Bodo saltans]|eukprot:CUE72869.1 Hypothetical protein, putative [Bodo saltans]
MSVSAPQVFFYHHTTIHTHTHHDKMSEATVEGFLAIAHHFHLGRLQTEASHPVTARLSQQCSTPETLPDGLRALQAVDVLALEAMLRDNIPEQTEVLAREIHDTFTKGKKVVCEGCGATGRLSLSLEVFAREGMVEEVEYQDKVIGFMAGGDAAFIRSIEAFEDKVEYGHKQLHAVNFEDGDLLLAITEGGETPFVIAACEEAVRVSPSRDPYFLYCNPDDILVQVAERSKRVLENPRIKKLNLTVGPMSITGSTRMQATTVQVLIAGLAIRHHAHPERIRPSLEAILAICKALPYGDLAPFTSAEAEMYANKEYFLYETDYFSVTVMTDTTERAPTFSMPPFESYNNPDELSSQVYLTLPGVKGPKEGWERLLRRPIRPLEWEDTSARTGLAAILGYDISESIAMKRQNRLGAERTAHRAIVSLIDSAIVLELPHKPLTVRFDLPKEIADDKLLVNVAAKMLLNAHSTAVMGVLKRYEGNVMTWVRPSNNKLIDRAARYITLLLERRWAAQGASAEAIAAASPSFEEICREVYRLRAIVATDQPIVLLVVDDFVKRLPQSE